MTVERYRELVSRAVQWARGHQSPQTGFLHHSPVVSVEERHDTIPILENFLFALALLRSKERENVQEGKDLILKLIPFQILKTGNFPTFLHEYPRCSDRFIGTRILPVLVAIRQDFSHILGDGVTLPLNACAEALLKRLLKEKKGEKIPESLAWQVDTCASLWRGEKIPDWPKDSSRCCHSRDLAHALWLTQGAPGTMAAGPARAAWNMLTRYYHRRLSHFAGPAFYERQEESHPDGHLLEPIMAAWLGSKRFQKKPTIDDLKAMVFRPEAPVLPDIAYPFTDEGENNGTGWCVHHDEKYTLFMMANEPPCPPAIVRGCHTLRLCWGNDHHLHSLVSQPSPDLPTDFVWKEGSGTLVFELPNTDVWKDKLKAREISLFANRHPDLILRVAGNQATTFQLGEELSLQSPELSVRLRFSLVKGSGHFMGHIAFGNRPAQLDRAGDKRFDAFDWHLFLRTIRRQGPCTIKLDLEIDSNRG